MRSIIRTNEPTVKNIKLFYKNVKCKLVGLHGFYPKVFLCLIVRGLTVNAFRYIVNYNILSLKE
jgi:hypothetical protein